MPRLGHPKDELLKGYAPDSADRQFIDAYFDLTQTAPIDALILLTANRVASVDGASLSCDEIDQLSKTVEILSKLTDLAVREHALTHVDQAASDLETTLESLLKALQNKRDN